MTVVPRAIGESPLVLVADDDTDIRELLADRLERAGYSVIQAGDGISALELIRQATPRLALLDVSMPLLSGLEVLQVMKSDSQMSEIPVVLLTGKSNDDEVTTGREMGAADYVVKPFSSKDIVLLIKKLM